MILLFLLVPLGLFVYSHWKYGDALSLMEQMMNVMAIAMLVGVATGFYFGGLFHGTFTHSLVASVVVAAILGMILGFPFKGLPVIEGLFSGAMAGMMGAMTAEMLPLSFVSTTVVLLLMVSVTAILWTAQRTIREHALSQNKTSHAYNYTWLVFSLVYLGFSFMVMITAPVYVEPGGHQPPVESHHQNHSHTP
ncbi:hypothetical protein [Alteribacter aurantiacus]|uniref:hypothetical protein n=1 Tax=Alteribacter aurantiacus TaxID=254410 RepID=UPI0004040E47|nr:hypothetical protein [Alteribacter aurantiacus]